MAASFSGGEPGANRVVLMPMLTNGGEYAIDFGGVQQLFFVRIAPNHGQPFVFVPHLRVTE